MRPARDANIPVRVKNSYNPQAPGTLITGERDMSEVTPLVQIMRLPFDNAGKLKSLESNVLVLVDSESSLHSLF